MESERLIGATVDTYRLVRLLGAGAMGAVYEAEHVTLGKRVALKLIHPIHAALPDVRARFRREARAAALVESEHIVAYHDVGEDRERGLYLVMELLEGEDLERRLAREGRLDARTAATVGAQVARGLARAHDAGVIHRDLKPANVFLGAQPGGELVAKVLDFGISKVLGGFAGGSADGITAPNLTLGTPQYMSPEQVRGLTLDARTDVWSLAAVLYEALRGAPAFEAQPYYETMLAILNQDVPHLRDVAPWVPAPLADAIASGLVRDRDRRCPDAHTFAERILAARPASDHPSAAVSLVRVRAGGERASATPRSRGGAREGARDEARDEARDTMAPPAPDEPDPETAEEADEADDARAASTAGDHAARARR